MRPTLAMILAVQMASGHAGLSLAPSNTAQAPNRPQPSAKQLYEDGRTAYRLGKFEVAVKHWEEAYALSERPLLLYNISLAYRRLYDISRDIKHLRSAQAVMLNFIKLAEADPKIELDDAKERLMEFDALIATAELEQRKIVPPPVVVEDEFPPPKPATASKGESQPASRSSKPLVDDTPGRAMWISGLATMAVGGAALLAGVGAGSYYALRGRAYSREIREDLETYSMDCGVDVPLPGCSELEADIEGLRAAGRQANRNAYISFGVGAGLGVVGLVVGGALYAIGKKRSATAQTAKVAPWVGPRGLGIRGRF